MIITDKLGVLYAPDGIAVHVDCNDEIKSLENGAIVVNRSNHPALLAGLDIMKSKVDAHPYYDGLGKGIKRHFNYSSLHDYNAFVILLNLSMKILYRIPVCIPAVHGKSSGCG